MTIRIFILLLFGSLGLARDLPPEITFDPGAINAVSIKRNNKELAINRASSIEPDLLLLTHARRDIVETARSQNPVRIWAPAPSLVYLEGTREHWHSWWEKRFDYYGQEVTQRPTRDFPADRYLDPSNGENLIVWEDLEIHYLPTPGYTRDGYTYFAQWDGKKVAFVGDLVLSGGKVRDLYSFQNEIRDARIGAYHGHLGRLWQWLKSIEAVLEENPDVMIPSRGPISTDPETDLRAAITQAREIYRNYLSTNALHWYFGEERMNTAAELVLGENRGVTGMPFAEHIDLPEWCQHIGTTKLLVSETGAGFALDVGGAKAFTTLQKAVSDGLITKLEGIFATHTHNDHTAAIGEAATTLDCPVYATPEVADVLVNPGNWFLPGTSPNEVHDLMEVHDGQGMKWHEFTLTFRFFPGQMYNHGALLVEKQGHEPVFFIGDSFSPSGIDDYCLMNRNLMRNDTGYALCFRILEEMPESTWLVNQHIPHLFRFSKKEREFLKSKYRDRGELISDFTHWDDRNYAIDERWASFYPYGQTISKGHSATTEIQLWNHSKVPRKFTISLEHPEIPETTPQSVTIPAREEGTVQLTLPVDELPEGIHVITATIRRDDGVAARSFCETLIRIEED